MGRGGTKFDFFIVIMTSSKTLCVKKLETEKRATDLFFPLAKLLAMLTN